MTTTTPTAPNLRYTPFSTPAEQDGTAVVSEPVTLRRVIHSEWIKFRTLRSTLAVLAGAMFGMVAVALVIAHNVRHLTPGLQPNDVAASGTLQGFFLAQLLLGALGVLFVSGEYSTGMIRSTLVAVPTRLPVLWAKLLVLLGITTTTMVAFSAVAFLAAQALISRYRPGFTFADPTVVRVVVGTGIFLSLNALAGAALAWIVRSTPGAIVAFVAIMYVLPELFSHALGAVGRNIAEGN